MMWNELYGKLWELAKDDATVAAYVKHHLPRDLPIEDTFGVLYRMIEVLTKEKAVCREHHLAYIQSARQATKVCGCENAQN